MLGDGAPGTSNKPKRVVAGVAVPNIQRDRSWSEKESHGGRRSIHWEREGGSGIGIEWIGLCRR